MPLAAFAHSAIAVICGTPAPLTTRVVQIDPGPMPTLIPSTPNEIKSRAPSNVATLPAIKSTSGNARLMVLIASITRELCPCAESTASTSTFLLHQFLRALQVIARRSQRRAHP